MSNIARFNLKKQDRKCLFEVGDTVYRTRDGLYEQTVTVVTHITKFERMPGTEDYAIKVENWNSMAWQEEFTKVTEKELTMLRLANAVEFIEVPDANG